MFYSRFRNLQCLNALLFTFKLQYTVTDIHVHVCTCISVFEISRTGPDINLLNFFRANSAEQEIYSVLNVKMSTIIGILMFININRINDWLSSLKIPLI